MSKTEKKVSEFKAADLEDTFKDLTASVICQCTFITDCVGGVPADEPGIRNFVQYQMLLTGDEAEKAVQRIIKEELGEKPVPALKPNGEVDETAELSEQQVYGINVLRHDDHGVWLGNWMIKACLKSAASRNGLFQKKRGSKGDLSEMGRVHAHGISLHELPERVYVKTDSTRFEKFMGRVMTPQGSKSIVHWSEVIPAGATFEFEFRFAGSKISEDEIVALFAVAGNIGIGSVKALERGKFRIDNMRLEK
jgi:hypothetical protein